MEALGEENRRRDSARGWSSAVRLRLPLGVKDKDGKMAACRVPYKDIELPSWLAGAWLRPGGEYVDDAIWYWGYHQPVEGTRLVDRPESGERLLEVWLKSFEFSVEGTELYEKMLRRLLAHGWEIEPPRRRHDPPAESG